MNWDQETSTRPADGDSLNNSQSEVRSNNARTPGVDWKPYSRTVEEGITSGMSNEDFWMLVRRFNKQVYHVKVAPETTTQQELDLNRVEEERFPAEKTRMTLERFYVSVVIGVRESLNHVVRLRSWKEPGRTSMYSAVYFSAWASDLLVPALMGILAALILCPQIRPLLFPPASVDSGSEQKGNLPAAGEPGSHGAVAGVPKKYKGEDVEQEASSIIDSISSVAIDTSNDQHGYSMLNDDDLDNVSETDPVETEPAADILTENVPVKEQKKIPMKKKASKATDQVMRVISDITDAYERFSNLLSPMPPFDSVAPRLRFAVILACISLLSLLVSNYMIVKTGGFLIGFGLFGGPIFQLGLEFLDCNIPDWKEYLDIQKTLLQGIPTNAQLTLTLLRIGEISSSPLPPPPSSYDMESPWPSSRKKIKPKKIDTSHENESQTGTSPDSSNQTQTQAQALGDNPPLKPKSKRRYVIKVLKIVRYTIAAVIKGHVAFDRAMAIAAAPHPRNLINMLRNKSWTLTPLGPLKFDAKFDRKRGTIVLDSSKQPPLLYFTTYNSTKLDDSDLQVENRKKGTVLFQIPVSEIRELKKVDSLGWKGKAIVKLTAGSKEATDGLVVSGALPGQAYHILGMRARNQLFNRLISMEAQSWESR